MRLTVSQLRRIIKEEVENVTAAGSEKKVRTLQDSFKAAFYVAKKVMDAEFAPAYKRLSKSGNYIAGLKPGTMEHGQMSKRFFERDFPSDMKELSDSVQKMVFQPLKSMMEDMKVLEDELERVKKELAESQVAPEPAERAPEPVGEKPQSQRPRGKKRGRRR